MKKLKLYKNKMKYSKPQIVAKNNSQGNFAAGCPNKDQLILGITACERAD